MSNSAEREKNRKSKKDIQSRQTDGGKFAAQDFGASRLGEAYHQRIAATQLEKKELEPKREFHVALKGEGPFILLPLSDIHYGSEATDYKELENIVRFIESNPNVFVIMVGDEIEGSNPKHRSTTEDGKIGSVQEQIEGFQRDVLSRISDRILGVVSGYWGHPEWLRDQGNVDPARMIYKGYDVQIIDNGSRLVIHLGDMQDSGGEETVVDVAHYFQGKSQIDSVYGQRQHFESKKGDDKPDIVIAGHIHRGGIAVELFPGLATPAILVQQGTLKGSNPELPRDSFGSKIGANHLPSPLEAATIITGKGERRPVLGFSQALFEANAIRFRDNFPQLSDEARAYITANPPAYKRRNGHSEVSDQVEEIPTDAEYEKMKSKSEEGLTRVYRAKSLADLYVHHDVNAVANYPINGIPLANARGGSSYSGLEDMRKLFAEEAGAEVFAIGLSGLFDDEIPQSSRRVEVLDEIVDLIKLIGPDRYLAQLIDGTMRSAYWRKMAGDSAPVPPATYINEKTGVPIVVGGGLLRVHVGPQARVGNKPYYDVQMIDGTRRLGSHFKPLSALKSFSVHHDLMGNDILVSGAMEHAGVGTDERDGEHYNYVDVGHASPFYNGDGKRNVQVTSPWGQSFLLYPSGEISLFSSMKETLEIAPAFAQYYVALMLGMVK